VSRPAAQRLGTFGPGPQGQTSPYAIAPRAAALLNGLPGFLVAPNGQPLALIGMAVRDDKITEIDILADPEPLTGLIH
jgi:hypothetical protein